MERDVSTGDTNEMSGRQKIELNTSLQDAVLLMAEGNPGGLRVLLQISVTQNGFMKILGLDDMNIRGEQVWVGYSDHCGQDLGKFLECIHNRSSDMVRTINNVCGARHTAVTSGASFK